MKNKAKSRGCPVCDGTTWRPVTLEHPHTGRLYEAVTSCACTSREPPPKRPKAKRPRAKQRELVPLAEVIADYPD